MQKIPYKTSTKFRSFSPKNAAFPKNLHLNNINNIGNFSDYYRIAKFGSNNNNFSNIFLYYSPKHININNARIRNVYSPIRKGFTLKKSSSQNNINFNRMMNHNQNFDNSLYNNSYTKTPNYNKKKIHYNLEKEKLYQETYQIRKMVKYLNKKLSEIKLENLKRDNQINRRQKKINDIIISNNESTILENSNNKEDINNNKRTFNINIYNDNSSYYNDFSVNSSFNLNNNNINNFEEVPIYSNFNLHTSKKSGTYLLLKKIKKSINEVNAEITVEKEKYENIKKSLFLTKLNELNIEATLLEEQMNKINTFIQKDILIQEENKKKKDNYINLQLNIERQEKIIKSLNERSNYLDQEEEKLRNILNDTKKKLETKTKKISINNEKLNDLIQKNNTLVNNKEIKNKQNKDKIVINHYPIKNPKQLKSYYSNEISKLNRIIKFYTQQCDFSEKEITKLKEQQIKVDSLNNNRNRQAIKTIKSDFGKNIINKNNLEPLSDKEKIGNIRNTLKEINKEKSFLKKKLEIYQNKLEEIENKNNEDDFYNKSQIEFGIDENNPFCTDNIENNPEKTGKFTSAQFNQFTYILFKNFEAQGISYEESKEKVIKLFQEFNQKNNLENILNENINYKSDKFNFIVEGYSKIILDVLNQNNNHNFLITKIFIKALFYNSEYDVNKLIEYFKVLFSYTRNHSLEEEKLVNKLKTKYKNLVEKLISCIKDFISKEGAKGKIRNKNIEYIDLLKVKNILEKNEINFKDKYIEFIFYYMKKFENPEAKLEDLKLSLLYDLVQSSDYNDLENSEMNINTKEENNLDNDINIDINKNDKNKNSKKTSKKDSTKKDSTIKENNKELEVQNNNNKNINEDFEDLNNLNQISIKEKEIKSNNNNINNNNDINMKEESIKFDEDIKQNENPIELKEPKKEKEKEKEKILLNQELDVIDPKAAKKSITEDNLTPKMQNMPSEFNNRREKNIDMDKENTDDMEEDEDSMTEITNEEYVKQLKEAIKQMKEGLAKAKTNFNDLMVNVIQKRKINGKFYEYVTIEDFNEQLKSVHITLTDLKLSCLCSKYCIPNELRLVDKNKIDKDIQRYIKGTLKLEEEENM